MMAISTSLIGRFSAPVEIIRTAGYKGISGIYAILNNDNGKVYVGSTSCLKTRIGHHRSELRNKKHDNGYLQSAWTAHGESRFSFLFLHQCHVIELQFWESVWMRLTACCCREFGYNLDSIAIRKMHSEETKLKISKANKGHKISDETKRKISIANTGYKHPIPKSTEMRARYSKALMGHFVSDETKAKMSLIHRGKKISEAQKSKTRLTNQLRLHGNQLPLGL